MILHPVAKLGYLVGRCITFNMIGCGPVVSEGTSVRGPDHVVEQTLTTLRKQEHQSDNC